MKYLIIAVLLVGSYAIYDYYNEEKIQQKKIDAASIITFKKEQINEITISKDDKTVKLSKEKDSWKLAQPVVDEANPEDVDSFLDQLLNEKNIQILSEDKAKDLSIFGLDKPYGSIQLKTNNGQQKTWMVSTKKNFQGEFYLKEEGATSVFTASNMWQNIVDKKMIEFRDKRWFRNSLSGVESIQIENNTLNEKFVLKKDGTQWVYSDNKNKVDQNLVREFLSKLNNNKVDEYIAESKPDQNQLNKWGFNKVLFNITLNFKEATPWIADFAESDKLALLKTNNPFFVLKINNQDWSDLKLRSKDSFRDRSEMFNFESKSVTQLDLDSPVKKIHLNKEAQSWVLIDDPKQGLNQGKIEGLISEIAKLEVKDFLGTKQPKGFNPQKHWALKNQQGEVILRLDLSDEVAKLAHYPEYFTLDKAKVERLQLDQIFSQPPTATPTNK